MKNQMKEVKVEGNETGQEKKSIWQRIGDYFEGVMRSPDTPPAIDGFGPYMQADHPPIDWRQFSYSHRLERFC